MRAKALLCPVLGCRPQTIRPLGYQPWVVTCRRCGAKQDAGQLRAAPRTHAASRLPALASTWLTLRRLALGALAFATLLEGGAVMADERYPAGLALLGVGFLLLLLPALKALPPAPPARRGPPTTRSSS